MKKNELVEKWMDGTLSDGSMMDEVEKSDGGYIIGELKGGMDCR